MKKIMFNDKFQLTQAVLEGRKTQTRRIITPQPTYQDNCGICWKGYAYGLSLSNELLGCYINFVSGTEYDKSCKRYRKGECVAVAQNYGDCGNLPDYELDEEGYPIMPKRSGYFNKMFVRADLMPYQIRITNVRVERLQDISDEDCLKEGIIKGKVGSEDTHFMDAYYIPTLKKDPFCTPQGAYSYLIDKIIGKGTWERNPYVFVYDFELVK